MRLAGLLLAAVLLPASARAQVPRALPDPFALPGGDWRASLESAAGVVTGSAEFRIRGGLDWVDPGSARAPFAFGLAAHGVRGDRRSWAGASANGRYTWRGSRFSAWLGSAVVAGTGDGAAWAVSGELGAGLGDFALELRSAWITMPEPGSLIVDSLLPRGFAFDAARSRYTEAELRAARRLGDVELHAGAGLRFGERQAPAEWLSGSVAVPVHARADILASAGRRPERPERGEIGGSFVTVGVRLRPGAMPGLADESGRRPSTPAADAAFSAVADGTGGWVISVRRPGARTVEINGDLTGWTPLALQPTGAQPSVHRANVRVEEGVYHVVMRVDGGAWLPPAGLPQVPDGFGGRSGLLVLRRSTTPNREDQR